MGNRIVLGPESVVMVPADHAGNGPKPLDGQAVAPFLEEVALRLGPSRVADVAALNRSLRPFRPAGLLVIDHEFDVPDALWDRLEAIAARPPAPPVRTGPPATKAGVSARIAARNAARSSRRASKRHRQRWGIKPGRGPCCPAQPPSS